MTALVADTSALIKAYVDESGSDWIRSQLTASEVLVYLSRITEVEVATALARRVREGSLDAATHRATLAGVRADFSTSYRVVPVDTTVVELAVDLSTRCALRAYDAVQLATALLVHASRTDALLTPPTFLSSDRALLQAAAAEGLTVDDPNLHP